MAKFTMHREINLSGGEITLLKTLGLSGTPTYGKLLVESIGDMEQAEFLDDLMGLMSLGYILADKVNVRTMEDVERTVFRVNASYARDLKDALHPGRRREREPRRRRRG
ncbi:MAG TPA: hypothetical protein VMO75_06805 [Chthoniobacterales bacterium]|nr:hypothetical protein [Chthoniobacterales bacterium]